MPIRKLKKFARQIARTKEDRINQQGLEKYAIILRIKKKHHAFYFYWPIRNKIRNSNNYFISKDPEMEIIEIHRVSCFHKEKINKRLLILDERIKNKKCKP